MSMILTVAFPVEALRGHRCFRRANQSRESLREIPNADRLIGQPVRIGVVVRTHKTFSKVSPMLHSAELYELRFVGKIVVLNWKIESNNGSDIAALAKIRGSENTRVLGALRLKPDVELLVDPVVGVTVLRGRKLQELNPSWLILESADARNLTFTSVLTEQLVTRVAIERSVLQWSTRPWKAWPLAPVKAPITAFVIRRWPSTLMASRPELQSQFQLLRETFNFPNVRAEVLERARSWWATAGFLVGLAALLISFFSRR